VPSPRSAGGDDLLFPFREVGQEVVNTREVVVVEHHGFEGISADASGQLLAGTLGFCFGPSVMMTV
jgi:hypothetical protein